MKTTVRTACTHDCPDACGLLAEVEDGRVVRLRGDPDHPVTRGFLCYRVGTHYLQRHESPERLSTPLLRRGDAFEPIDWEDALDLAARELDRIRRESGAAAILHTQGGGSLGILKTLNTAFSRLLGATETRGEVCDGAGSFANEVDFGAVDANDPDVVHDARGVLLWGRNVAASSPHVASILSAVKKAGTPIWLIDPMPTQSRSLADRAIQPMPGGDAALAFGAGRVVLEDGLVDEAAAEFAENLDEYAALVNGRSVEEWETMAGVPAGTARDLARFLAERSPVTTLIGWGVQRRHNAVNQVRAIDALCAITGNIGRAGAGVSFSTSRRAPFDLSFVAGLADRVPRTLLLPRLGREIEAATAPPIRAVVIDNHNPVATNPDSATTARALRSREFVMVLDPFLTDTARTANLVLPTTMMLEEADLVGSYGHHFVTASRPVATRRAGDRSDLEIYQALADRLGFGESLAGSADEWMTRLARPVLERHWLDLEALRDRAVPTASRVAFEGRRFATPSGRCRLVTEFVPPAPVDSSYPLRLLSLSSGRWQTSQLTDADEAREGPLCVTVHPRAAPGLSDGERARLRSRVGAIEVVVRFDPSFRDDLAHVPRARSVAARRCVNLLVGSHLTDGGESAAFYDEGVRLEPL